MENGVESIDRPLSEEETRTADGGISKLKLADNVVQVFHEPNVSEGDVVETIDRPLSEEETRTADGEISKLKLADNVVQVFHERNVSEGDDVFEEAMDGSPEEIHAQEHGQEPGLDEAIVNGDDESVEKKNGDLNLLEVNGSSNGGHTIEKFEEAIDIGSPIVDPRSEVEQPIVAEKKMESLVTAKPEEEGRVSEGVVDGHSYVKDVLPEELNDGVEENVKEVVKEVSAVIDDEEKMPFVKEVSAVVDDEEKMPLKDVKEDVNGSCDVIVHEKAENGDEDEVKLREMPTVHTNSSNVNHVSLDETGLSHGNESSEQIVREDGQSWELKDTTAYADTPVNEEKEIPETKDVTTNLSDSVNEETGAQETINPPSMEDFPTEIDGRVDAEAEPDTKDGQKFGTQYAGQNNEEGWDSHDVLEKPEGHETQIEQDKQGYVIDDLGESSMAKGTETEPVVKNAEEHETQNEQEKQEREIKELVESSMAEEMKIEPVVKNPEEHVTQNEQEKQDPEIKELGESSMAEETQTQTLVQDPEDHEIENEQEKQDPEIKELGESGMLEERKTQPVVKDPKEHEAQNEKEKQVPEIKELGDSSMVKERNTQPAVEPSPTRRPAGLGSAAPLLEPTRAPQQPRVNGAVPQRQTQLVEDAVNGEAEENDETREKLQMIRVKFLRLAHRLGQTPHNVVVAQVLYRLGLAEQLRGRNQGRVGAFSFDRASAMAEQLEAAGQEPLDFSCTIMVLGKTGVGKSATINSIFDEVKFGTDAFQMGTKKVQDVVGTVQGIKVRVIDTPGLLPCWSDQRQNEKILHSVKRFIKKNPPDIVLYLDRLDMQSRDFGDMPLLRTITEIFGPSIWFNAIVVLTHAASAPPDGPNGTASSYEMFVTQRSHVVQQAIRQAAGDMRLMNPVSLVENHSACRTNRAGQRVLPNGQVWKPHLLLLSFASKILAEANTLLKLQDSPPGKPFATRSRVPPLPFLLSSLLQSRAQVKLPEEQYGDEDGLDEDLDESSDSDDESDYDELPPFKSLTKAQLAKLSKAQKKAYFDELEYREKLFMKKQLKEEKKRRKLLKKMEASAKDLPNEYSESVEEESGGAASVPVAMPDFALPISFDSDNPTHRYRFLDSSNQWLVRPVLETHGWDHDVGYEGINVERLFVVKEKIPLSFSGQVTKDKKESNLQMELASSIKHGEGKATSLGFDMQTIGKDMAYTLRSDTRFSNFRRNKTAAGLSVTLLGDAFTAGVKLEDKLIVNKRFRVVMTGGAMTGRGDVAYGGSLEATLRDKDYPLGRTLSTLGLSIMDWHGDLAIGCNVQSQVPVGRSTNLVARANLNNRGTGQVSIRLNSSEQLQIALIGLVPLLRKIYGQYQQMLHGE
ncbi:AIG1 [Macleaya cordata]|uniref:AIG1 n=1 Tax=Macleaya cordata TaxID=56857 RepID=A0A200RAA6_MACCD|nr:AIG1 [Macleaya cordata]